MARVFCPAPVNFVSRTAPGARRPYAFDVAIVTLATWSGRALEKDLTSWPDAVWQDDGLRKRRAEWLVAGSAFAPKGNAVRTLGVRVTAGSAKKSLAVFGPRMWKGRTPSNPAPFTEMPLDWAHAFGGEGFADNPIGQGLAPNSDGLHLLPSVEDPRYLVVSPSDKPQPAGFGAVPADAPSRAQKLGTYGDAWLEKDWPGYARDLDPTYFNVAPSDQWLPEGQWWQGDEVVVAEGMHAEHPLLEGRLPSLKARCFVNQRLAGGEAVLREVGMHLETLVLLPNLERVALVFRGTTEVAEDDGDDILHVVAALEAFDEPKAVEHYRTAFKRRLDRKIAREPKDDDLLPSAIKPTARLAGAAQPDLGELVKTERLLSKNFRRRAEIELARTRERLEAEGVDPDERGVPKELPPAIDELDDDQAEKMIADAEEQANDLRAQVEGKLAAETERLRAVCAEQGIDFDAKVAENKKSEGGPPRFRATDVIDRLEDAATLCRNAGIADADNPVLPKLGDVELRASLTRMEVMALDTYRRHAHLFPAAAVLEGDEAARARQRVVEALAATRNLARQDLTGVNLSGLDLSGCDLSEALLERADLRDCNLEGVNLTGAVLTRADLGGARTRGVRLAGANLGDARLDGLDLASVDLRGAILGKADLRAANLSGANLEQCDLDGANLAEANLEGVKASGATFTGARLDRTRFARADLAGASFEELDLSGLDFSGACLDGAELHACSGDEANFSGASMNNARFTHIEPRSSFRGADFSGARLEHANLRDLDLRGAKFIGAQLSDADLSKSECEGADFTFAVARRSLWMRTNLTNANLRSANLREAMMQNAELAGATLRAANLFAANLVHVRVDGATDIAGAELGQILYREERR